jgi:class 3 adenylate cyclase
MLGTNHLLDYIKSRGVTKPVTFSDGALLNPVQFPLALLETNGAILFADLPGYSKLANQLEPAECTCMVNNFFAWFEGEAGRHFGGIVDKFIGDEVMVVFPQGTCKLPPLIAAMHTTRAMLENDPYAFDPKIGMAAGPFAIGVVGTEETAAVSAIGHTVNLAARCTGRSMGRHTVRIATSDIGAVRDVFKDDVWKVCPPKRFKPKNMSAVKVVDILRLTKWVPAFNYLEDVRARVRSARAQGAIQKEG